MIAGLAAGANDLSDAARALVGAARLTRLEKGIAVALLLVNTMGMIGVVVVSILVLNIAQGNEERSRDSKAVLEAVSSCTTPGGACYERGSERTAQAVSRLLQTQIVVAECDRQLPASSSTEAQFEACVADRIARLPE